MNDDDDDDDDDDDNNNNNNNNNSITEVLRHHVRPVLEPTQRPVQWVPGAFTPGVKWPGREAHHSPPSSAEVRNVWGYNFIPPIHLLAWCLIKHRVRLHGAVLS